MSSQITLSALQSKWAVVGSIAIVSYDYFLTLDREIQYIWRRKFTSASAIYIVTRYSSLAANIFTLLNFFPWPGKSTPTSLIPSAWQKCNALARAFTATATVIIMSSAVFSSLRAYALCQCKPVSYLVLALGSGNAVPLIYEVIKTQATYDPGTNNIDTMCKVDFSPFISFRNALLVLNVMNLVFIKEVKVTLHLLSLDFIGALSATAAVLTCRFILDLFEASTRTRFGTGPTVRLSAMPSMILSRSLASRHVGGPDVTGTSQGIFDADVSRHRTEESESVYGTTDDYDFELQPVNLERQKSNVHPLLSES
ncbi:uncharacterized protein BXZ73DRAFT_98062 [Epithele typhae]|uniref:uncharacterized protein n=1 Tax=Epithele typhae TaxID=378194 RepID=UPI002007F318|nr:uncharacterized protein BXZ73DRAFT_98062 [Epithele typhae]KAH9941674.1 hypothetical protein BXZ73DRAFT_98062 [Epithele typhae]